MQPIENVVEDLMKRDLAHKTSFGLAQIGIYMLFKLSFSQFRWNLAHDDLLSILLVLSKSSSHHYHFLSKSLNEFIIMPMGQAGRSVGNNLKIAYTSDQHNYSAPRLLQAGEKVFQSRQPDRREPKQ